MAGKIVEADILEGEAQLLSGALGSARLARQEARHIDQRDLAADHGRRRQRGLGGTRLRLHRSILWQQRHVIMRFRRAAINAPCAWAISEIVETFRFA
jgi:hypothetical protein